MKCANRYLVLAILVVRAFAVDTPSTQPAASDSNHNAASSDHPNIILVTLDTTRADRMDFLGSKRGLTPNLDIFARDSAAMLLRKSTSSSPVIFK